jgi:hypothetical protein
LEEAAPVYKEVAAPFEEAAVVSGDAAEALVEEEKTAEIATGVAEAHSGGGGAAVPGPRDGVAGGVLAAAGAELECNAAADGGVDAVSAGSGVSEEPAVLQGAVAGVPAADSFGEESVVGAGNPLVPEERATKVGEATEIAYLLPWDEVEDVEGVRGLIADAVDSSSVESRVLEPVGI